MAVRAKSRKTFKQHLLGMWPDFKITSEMFLLRPFTKTVNGSVWLNKMATRAKKKKKGVDCHASINNLLKRRLLQNGLMDF